MDQVIQKVRERLRIDVRGFQWIGQFQQPHQQHFIDFRGWDGEVYVKGIGIMTFVEYYRYVLSSGYCLLIDGIIVGRTTPSTHYNSLHKEQLKRSKGEVDEDLSIPVKSKEVLPIVQSQLQLYKIGFFTFDEMKERVKKYILEEKKEEFFHSLKKGKVSA